jgi:hypothetical protein
MEAKRSQILQSFQSRTESARQTFLGRATGSLVKHLETFGEGEIWSYDASGLRILLRSAYQVFVKSSAKSGLEIYETTTADINALYAAMNGDAVSVAIAPPSLPSAPPPVALGQTIALDLRGTWWTRFWRRQRGYQAFADDFAKLIHEETIPIVETLRKQHAEEHAKALSDTLEEFIETQKSILLGIHSGANGTSAEDVIIGQSA